MQVNEDSTKKENLIVKFQANFEAVSIINVICFKEDMLIRPVVIESKGSDGKGNSFFQKKVIVKGVGIKQAPLAGSSLDELLDTFDREYNEDKKREESLAEQRRLDRIGESLKNENHMIGDILSMIDHNKNYDLPETLGLVNPLPLNLAEAQPRAQVVLNEQPRQLQQSSLAIESVVEPENSQSMEESDEIIIDSILKNIFGENDQEGKGMLIFSSWKLPKFYFNQAFFSQIIIL
jgi:hypothetical protein